MHACTKGRQRVSLQCLVCSCTYFFWRPSEEELREGGSSHRSEIFVVPCERMWNWKIHDHLKWQTRRCILTCSKVVLDRLRCLLWEFGFFLKSICDTLQGQENSCCLCGAYRRFIFCKVINGYTLCRIVVMAAVCSFGAVGLCFVSMSSPNTLLSQSCLGKGSGKS